MGITTAIALAGCGGAGPVADDAARTAASATTSTTVPSTSTAPASATPSSSSPAPAPASPRASGPAAAPKAPATPAGGERRDALLDGLRSAGVPVSADGAREVRMAETACAMVAQGMTTDDLAAALSARYPVPAPFARRMAGIVVATYC